MKNANEYYNATMNNQPSGLIRKFFKYKFNEKMVGNLAIDLGCGVGNDTEFLNSRGFRVTAIDSEEQVRHILEEKIIDKTNLDVVIGDFSEIELPTADLILANMSLFFVKDNFETFLKSLLEKVNKKGFFVANFLGQEDEWNKSKTTMGKDELLSYFEKYKIHYFSEEKYYADTALGKNKFWHVYTIMAQLVI